MWTRTDRVGMETCKRARTENSRARQKLSYARPAPQLSGAKLIDMIEQLFETAANLFALGTPRLQFFGQLRVLGARIVPGLMRLGQFPLRGVFLLAQLENESHGTLNAFFQPRKGVC